LGDVPFHVIYHTIPLIDTSIYVCANINNIAVD